MLFKYNIAVINTSSIKLISFIKFKFTTFKIIKNKRVNSLDVLIINKENIFSVFNSNIVNKTTLKKEVLSHTFKNPLDNLNKESINFLFRLKKKNLIFFFEDIEKFMYVILYPFISKFWLLGRHYKLRRKSLILLKCRLNYSHKVYYINTLPQVYISVKRKIVLMTHKVLFINLLPFTNIKYINYNFYKLRKVNIYSPIRNKGKGIKSMQIFRRKRIGKSDMK